MLEKRDYIGRGKIAPDFCLLNKDEMEICLRDFSDNWVVLHFFKDTNSELCSTQAIEYTKILPEFQKLQAKIIGIVPEEPLKISKFARKYDLDLILLSDLNYNVSKMYGVLNKKEFTGREIEEITRSTYLIGPNREVKFVWPRVVPKNHPKDVMDKLRQLKTSN